MHALVHTLSGREPPAANALTVVAFFDRLVHDGAGATSLLRATAGLLGCTVGCRTRSGGLLRTDSRGALFTDAPSEETVTCEHPFVDGGSVWTESHPDDNGLTAFVLERLALAIALAPATAAARSSHADALYTLLGSAPGGAQDSAITRLSMRADRAHRIVLALPRPGIHGVRAPGAASGMSPTGHVVPYQGGTLSIWPDEGLATEPDLFGLPGMRTGVSGRGTPYELQELLGQAHVALRMTDTLLAREHTVVHDALGGLANLADATPSTLGRLPGVGALRRMESSERGRADLRAFGAYLATGSLRAAAAETFLHHSSVAAAVTRIETAAALSTATAVGRLAALAAVVAAQLLTVRAADVVPLANPAPFRTAEHVRWPDNPADGARHRDATHDQARRVAEPAFRTRVAALVDDVHMAPSPSPRRR